MRISFLLLIKSVVIKQHLPPKILIVLGKITALEGCAAKVGVHTPEKPLR